jgi:hypothetical protein
MEKIGLHLLSVGVFQGGPFIERVLIENLAPLLSKNPAMNFGQI